LRIAEMRLMNCGRAYVSKPYPVRLAGKESCHVAGTPVLLFTVPESRAGNLEVHILS